MPRLMQRLRGEDGATGVFVALILVPVLIGAAALTVDVGSMFTEREQLQNGADAAALAIAQTCAKGSCNSSLGSTYVTENHNVMLGGSATALVNLSATNCSPTITSTNSYVRVDATGTVQHPLATLLGNWVSGGSTAGTSHNVTTYACATWGYPSSYAPLIPLVIGQCQYDVAKAADPTFTTHPIQTLLLANQATACPNAALPPGGFGWLDSTACSALVLDGTVGGSPGASIPSSPSADCKAILDSYLNKELLLPVFKDPPTGTGQHANFVVVGFAGFVPTAWNLPSDSQGSPTCGNNFCFQGYFTKLQPDADGAQLGGPNLGSIVVELAK